MALAKGETLCKECCIYVESRLAQLPLFDKKICEMDGMRARVMVCISVSARSRLSMLPCFYDA